MLLTNKYPIFHDPQTFPQVDIEYFQSNVEGEIVDRIHQAGFGNEANLRSDAAHPEGSLADASLSVGLFTF